MSETSERIFQVATITDILELAGITPPRGRENIRCPLPEHRDGTPSFSVLPSNKGWKCHGCGPKGGVLDLAVALEIGGVKTRSAAISYLAKHYGIPEEPLSPAGSLGSFRRSVPRPKPMPRVTPLESAKADEASLAEVAAWAAQCVPLAGTVGAEYLRSRGIETDAADAYGVRFHSDWYGRGPAVVFPSCDKQGKLVGLVGRFCRLTFPPGQSKVMNKGEVSLGVFSTPGALKTSKDGLDGPVAIVEGLCDAIALGVKGMRAIALCGVNTPDYGGRNSWLLSALAGKPVVLAFDNDSAGRKAAAKIESTLRSLGCRITHLTFDGEKDAADLLKRDPEKLDTLVRAAIIEARQPYWDLLNDQDAA